MKQAANRLGLLFNLKDGGNIHSKTSVDFRCGTHLCHDNLNPTYVHDHIHEIAALLLILGQLNPVYSISFHFTEIHLSSLNFPYQNFICISLLSHTLPTSSFST
jgi:hypothetical protein